MESSIRVSGIASGAESDPVKPRVKRRFWKRFSRNRLAVVGLVFLLVLILAAAVGPSLFPEQAGEMQLGENLMPPSRAHPLGTDELGRDLLARLIEGARISLAVGVISVSISLALGVPLGAVAAYVGGWLDMVLMRVVDVLLTFPTLLTAIILVTVLGPSLQSAVVAIGITQVPIFARLTRALVLTLRDREFVTAARASGASDGRVLARHIMPNCLSPLLVQTTLIMASAILSTAYLGFLGLGAQPPTPEWGAMVANGRNYLRTATHVAVFPGIAIMLTVLALNVVGDGLRDAFDPQSDRATKV